MKKTAKGFTLIELLITISIIAILAAMGLIAYSTVLEQGRDSKRQADLRSIQSALEQYYSDQGYYPEPGTTDGCPDTNNGKLWFGCALKDPAGNKTYINEVPSDPAESPQYTYQAFAGGFDSSSRVLCDNSGDVKCSLYCLAAKLKNSNPGLGKCGEDEDGVIPEVFYNFAVTLP